MFFLDQRPHSYPFCQKYSFRSPGVWLTPFTRPKVGDSYDNGVHVSFQNCTLSNPFPLYLVLKAEGDKAGSDCNTSLGEILIRGETTEI